MSDTLGKLDFPIEPIIKLAHSEQTPFYLYDEKTIVDRCNIFNSMPNAYGITPRYAMKANSNRAILQLIRNCGLSIDASSLNEVRRANLANIEYSKIMLTTQEAPIDNDLEDLKVMIEKGLKYNICSLTQLNNILPFGSGKKFSIRIHPGIGSGESASRNTGDKYSCFGIHLTDLPIALDIARNNNIVFDQVHVHIGSGGDPDVWRENIDRELGFVTEYLDDVTIVNFGGGFKESRMPNDISADVNSLGLYAKQKLIEFYENTGRKLKMEVEPGTFILANSGYLITRVSDIKKTGSDGFTFILLNGGMEVNSRPLLYGSKHPFYILSPEGEILFDEFKKNATSDEAIVVGRCCESGDSFTLNDSHEIVPRSIRIPSVGDIFVIGGSGAYLSSMTPFNYNSHVQVPEFLYRINSDISIIRKKQSLAQIIQNELDL